MLAVEGAVRTVPLEVVLTLVWWQSKVRTKEQTASKQRSRFLPDLSQAAG